MYFKNTFEIYIAIGYGILNTCDISDNCVAWDALFIGISCNFSYFHSWYSTRREELICNVH